MKALSILFPLTLWALPVAADEAAPAVTIVEVAPTATVAGDTVRLGDVAALPAEHPLAQVNLVPAPLPGCRRLVTRGEIEVRLAHAGYGSANVVLRGAESVVVQRASRQLTPTDIQTALGKLLAFKVELDRLPPRRPLPLGTLSFRLRGDLPNPLPDQFSINVDVLVDGRVADQLNIGLRLPPAAPVAVAAPVPAAMPARVDAQQPTPQPTPQPAAQPAAPAAPAAPPAPAKPAWQVRYGDALTIRASSGRASITLPGVARQTGTLGDVISVEAQVGGQRRTLRVKLTAPDSAVMEL